MLRTLLNYGVAVYLIVGAILGLFGNVCMLDGKIDDE